MGLFVKFVQFVAYSFEPAETHPLPYRIDTSGLRGYKPLFTGGVRRFAERHSHECKPQITLALRRIYGRGSMGTQKRKVGTPVGEAPASMESTRSSSVLRLHFRGYRPRVSARKYGISECERGPAVLAGHSYCSRTLQARGIEGRLPVGIGRLLDCRRSSVFNEQFQYPSH